MEEVGIDQNNKTIVRVNKQYYRPTEVDDLISDCSKAKKELGWFPTYNVKDSVKITTEWYLKVFKEKKSPLDITNKQIENYMKKNKLINF